MNLILLGAPGAGKGTQAELICQQLNIPSISTGNMLRDAMKRGTEVGKKAQYYMDNGLLVPDDVVLALVEERVAKPDCARGFILDGFPRTIHQAQVLGERGVRIDHVISIEVDDNVIEGRMSGRRVCADCGASYHVVATSRGAHLCRGPSSWGPISEVGRYGSQGPLHLAPLDLHDPEAPFPLPPTLPGPAALEEAGTESSCPIHTSCSVGISLHPLWVGPQAQVSGG